MCDEYQVKFACRKLRKGGGKYVNKEVLRGLGLSMCLGTRQTRGVWGHAPPGIFEKRHALRSILVHFWPCITCIILYQYQVFYIYNIYI